MTQAQITIIGMGLVGTSLGLALKASGHDLHLVGHDAEVGRGRLALKKGALDESKVNLISACENADLVVLAIPISGIRETLEAIGPNLKPGCVVTDTATLKAPVLAWADEILPPEIPFVGGDPVFSPAVSVDPGGGLEAARADLFQGAVYCLSAMPDTPPTALKRVSDMVNLIEARPFYPDPLEHDGLRAAVDGLPTLVGLALAQTVVRSPSWLEGRKLADYAFKLATSLVVGDANALRAMALLNRENLLPWLDSYLRELHQLRELVAAADGDQLDKTIAQTLQARDRWLQDREFGDWEDSLTGSEMPKPSEVIRQRLGLGGTPSD